jgi:hypothetical protein
MMLRKIMRGSEKARVRDFFLRDVASQDPGGEGLPLKSPGRYAPLAFFTPHHRSNLRFGGVGHEKGRHFMPAFEGGGERGIRTLDTVTRITVFETAPFNRSGISPGVCEGREKMTPRRMALRKGSSYTNAFSGYLDT